MNVKIHKAKDPVWINAAGDAVPVKFVPETDKLKESLAGIIYKSAVTIEAELKDFYELMTLAFEKAREAVVKEYNIKGKEKKQGKGSFTWYNFDRSLKIEADINDIVKWDGPLMTEAQDCFEKFFSGEMSESQVLIKDIVIKAFSNSSGQPDTKNVFKLLKFETKIKNKNFQKACELIKQAQNIDKTKLYMRVWEKTDSGEYRSINLNFSSI